MKYYKTKINDLPLNSFNAELLDYTVGDSSYSNGYILPPLSILPIRLEGRKGLRPITLSLDFSGDERREIELKISEMKAILQQGADILLPDGFYYYTVYESCSTTQEVAPWLVNAQFSLLGVRHGVEKKETLSKSGKIFVDGNSDTPAVFKIETKEKSVSVNNIKISNINNTIIVDGIEKTVLENGINKFSETEMIAFPKLKSGWNEITISGNATVEISYYPMFI